MLPSSVSALHIPHSVADAPWQSQRGGQAKLINVSDEQDEPILAESDIIGDGIDWRSLIRLHQETLVRGRFRGSAVLRVRRLSVL
jgi:hypothetical protein